MDKVAFGFLGTKLDAMGGFGEKRHTVWRPSISLGLDKSVGIARLELWHERNFQRLAEQIKEDIESTPDGAEVVLRCCELKDPWNFEEVYSFLYDFSNNYNF